MTSASDSTSASALSSESSGLLKSAAVCNSRIGLMSCGQRLPVPAVLAAVCNSRTGLMSCGQRLPVPAVLASVCNSNIGLMSCGQPLPVPAVLAAACNSHYYGFNPHNHRHLPVKICMKLGV